MDQALTSFVTALPLPAILIGADARVAAINTPAGDLLGNGLAGRHYMTILRQPAVLQAIEACDHSRQPQETRYLSNDGANDTTYEAHCAPVEMGEQRGVLVTFNDITHLQQASQMRRDFVANVSHELRSPLTALMGFIETLKGPAKDDAEASERFLGIMQKEASRMERLVHDLLSLSRVEAEERVRPSEAVDLGGLTQSVIHALTPLASTNDLTLNFTPPEEPVIISGNSDQLRQVLTNLIENAIKYGGSDAGIDISMTLLAHDAALATPAVAVAVRDHGAGFDPIHIPRLTERFYRVDNHRSREMGGTGLGLAIVKHILNRHRGRLHVTSTPGEGSEFRAILPR